MDRKCLKSWSSLLFFPKFFLGSRQGPLIFQIQDCTSDPNNNQCDNGEKIQKSRKDRVQLPNIEISDYCDGFQMAPLETMSPFDFMAPLKEDDSVFFMGSITG